MSPDYKEHPNLTVLVADMGFDQTERGFCQKVLSPETRAAAIRAYNLSPEEQAMVLTIEAQTLEGFAAAILRWVEEETTQT